VRSSAVNDREAVIDRRLAVFAAGGVIARA
jgi:hypothetical protein